MYQPRWGGKEKIIAALMNKEGYSYQKSKVLVDKFFAVVKKALGSGKQVEIEGLGVLTVERYFPIRRRISRNLKHCKPTILTVNKYKTIRLKHYKVLED